MKPVNSTLSFYSNFVILRIIAHVIRDKYFITHKKVIAVFILVKGGTKDNNFIKKVFKSRILKWDCCFYQEFLNQILNLAFQVSCSAKLFLHSYVCGQMGHSWHVNLPFGGGLTSVSPCWFELSDCPDCSERQKKEQERWLVSWTDVWIFFKERGQVSIRGNSSEIGREMVPSFILSTEDRHTWAWD